MKRKLKYATILVVGATREDMRKAVEGLAGHIMDGPCGGSIQSINYAATIHYGLPKSIARKILQK